MSLSAVSTKNKIYTRKGQAMVELALTIPFFAAILFGVLEFTVMFVQKQRVAQLSREVANAAFRDCGALNTEPELHDCIQTIADNVNSMTISNRILSGFADKGKIAVHVYNLNPLDSNNPNESIYYAGTGTVDTSGGFTVDPAIVTSQKMIAVGEVFYRYDPIAPMLVSFLHLDPALFKRLYGVTIY